MGEKFQNCWSYLTMEYQAEQRSAEQRLPIKGAKSYEPGAFIY
jgi:hypothetical protein